MAKGGKLMTGPMVTTAGSQGGLGTGDVGPGPMPPAAPADPLGIAKR